MNGLFLKILAITAVVGGLVFADQLVSSHATPHPSSQQTAASLETAAPRVSSPGAPATVANAESQPAAPVSGEPVSPRRRALIAVGKGGGTNFVSVCRYTHSNQDDPIVFPGAPGATHHHDFFGNTTTNASSTYQSLRAGSTTCRIQGDTAAYWAPSLWANGKLVQPVLARIYYLPGRKDNKTVRAFPAGLRVLAKGDNVVVRWSCVGRDQRTKAQSSPPTCPQGTHLVEHIRFPDCWDGHNLDSPDHTSHMTFARGGACPASHPVPVPAIVLNIHYPTQGGNVTLGFPDKPVAAHADFFNAWNQTTLDRLVRECINAGLHCGANPPGANV